MQQASPVLSFSLVLAVVMIITGISCEIRAFNNPVDPASSSYQGIPSEDIDGEGKVRYVDVDEIVSISPADGASVASVPILLPGGAGQRHPLQLAGCRIGGDGEYSRWSEAWTFTTE